MREDRDWIDFTQLGLSAVQTHRLGQISSEISHLRELEEAREEKAAKLNSLRNMVLRVEEIIEALEEDGGVERYPQNRYVGAQFLLSETKKHGILPGSEQQKERRMGGIIIPEQQAPLEFESFEDKLRQRNLEKRLKAICDKALTVMTDEQKQGARLCWQFMREDTSLAGLIERAKRRGDPVKRKERELERLRIKLMEIQSESNGKQGFGSVFKRLFARNKPEDDERKVAKQIDKTTKKLDDLKARAAAKMNDGFDLAMPLREAGTQLGQNQLMQMREQRQALVRRIMGTEQVRSL